MPQLYKEFGLCVSYNRHHGSTQSVTVLLFHYLHITSVNDILKSIKKINLELRAGPLICKHKTYSHSNKPKHILKKVIGHIFNYKNGKRGKHMQNVSRTALKMYVPLVCCGRKPHKDTYVVCVYSNMSRHEHPHAVPKKHPNDIKFTNMALC